MTDSTRIINAYLRAVQQRQILGDVNKEIKRQDGIWGEQNHSLTDWITILGEEFGEVCKEVSEMRMAKGLTEMTQAMDRLDEELIQVVTVFFRILEKVRLKNANS